MTYLVIAPEGMLGRAWTELLQSRGRDYRAAGLPDLDITDASSVARHMEGVDVVINCAGFTDVDGAEEREDEALRVNGEGPRVLAEACKAQGALLVHVSTDYVFRGNATEPYPVDTPIDPINAYGRTKAAGERAIDDVGGKHLIVRTSWLYAPWAPNFVRTMARLGKERDELSVVHDQRGRPTSAEHLARATFDLVEHGAEGVFHVTDGGECTWFEFASHIVGRVDPTCVVRPCTSAEFPRPAPRPAYSVLDLSGTEAALGEMPSWQANVDAVLERL